MGSLVMRTLKQKIIDVVNTETFKNIAFVTLVASTFALYGYLDYQKRAELDQRPAYQQSQSPADYSSKPVENP